MGKFDWSFLGNLGQGVGQGMVYGARRSWEQRDAIEHLREAEALRQTAEETKRARERADWEIYAEPVAQALMSVGMPESVARPLARAVGPEKATAYGTMLTSKQRADTGDDLADIRRRLADLAKEKEYGTTPMSSIKMKLLDSQQRKLEGLTDPSRVSMNLMDEQIRSLRGDTTPQQALIEQRRAATAKTRAEIPFVGQEKKPTDASRLVAAKYHEIRRLQPKNISAGGLKGWLGGKDTLTTDDQIEEMITNAPDAVTRRAIEIARDQYLQEQLTGGQEAARTTAPRSPTAKSRLSGQRTNKPDGTYTLNGETFLVRGGVIQ